MFDNQSSVMCIYMGKDIEKTTFMYYVFHITISKILESKQYKSKNSNILITFDIFLPSKKNDLIPLCLKNMYHHGMYGMLGIILDHAAVQVIFW